MQQPYLLPQFLDMCPLLTMYVSNSGLECSFQDCYPYVDFKSINSCRTMISKYVSPLSMKHDLTEFQVVLDVLADGTNEKYKMLSNLNKTHSVPSH